MICPICQNPFTTDFSPFCSKACRNSDLLGWLDEEYRVPCEDPVWEEKGFKEEED